MSIVLKKNLEQDNGRDDNDNKDNINDNINNDDNNDNDNDNILKFEMNIIPKNLSFKQLIPMLVKSLSKGNYHEDPVFSEIQQLMENYDASIRDWQRYAIWENDNKKYGRNLIARTELFTLMLLTWPPDVKSPIHDHGGSQCWLRVLTGEIEEHFYEKPQDDQFLKRRFIKSHPSGGVCFINDNRGLHCIINPSKNEGAVTLHCYVPGYVSCNAYFDELSKDKGKKTCFLSFTSVGGRKVVH